MYDRIAIIGCSGSGKTTLARRIHRQSEAPIIELDAIHWQPGWTAIPRPELRAEVDRRTSGRRWICVGNYSVVRDLVWPRADTLIWLDPPLHRVMRRVTSRTIARVVSREELWNGNRESFWSSFASRDSIILWALRTHGSLRRRYEAETKEPAYGHLRVYRVRSERAFDAVARQASRAGGP